MNNSFSKVAVWMVIALVLFTVFKQFDGRAQTQDGVTYTQFMDDAKAGRIRKVDVQGGPGGDVLYVTPDAGRAYTLTSPGDLWMVSDLLKYGVQVSGKPREEQSLLMSIFVSWFPMLLLIGVWVFFMRQMQGGGRGGAFSFGKSRARMLDENTNQITFVDVAGCDEAKEDVQELVDFLRDPSKFQKLGGRIPRGVLMVGSPGTGKTLLAKAIAGEAKVPFFSISGSDFVEMFVGARPACATCSRTPRSTRPASSSSTKSTRSAASVAPAGRRQRRTRTDPEPDAGRDGRLRVGPGRHRDRRDQPSRRARPRAAASGPLRPPGRGAAARYPRPRADPEGPHAQGSAVAERGRDRPGARHPFSGADLANLVNEAALFAARRNGRTVDMSDFEKAKDKIIMGAERRSIVMPEEERKNTAYHESGHAIVARMLPKTDPVHKVTIIPRGRALGVTMQLPETDRYSMDKGRLLSTIAVLFGGRIAEEIFMDQMTTGASNDFERATAIARDIVTRYGMTDELGPMVYAENEGEVFLGRSVTKTTHMSEATMQKVDTEIRRIIDEQYSVARKILEDNRDKVEVMTSALLEWETIDADQIDDIIEGRPPRPPKTPQGPSDTSDTPPTGLAAGGNTAAAV